MTRIFSLLAAITVFLTLLVGIGVQWLSQSAIADSKQKAAEAIAQSVAITISGQLDLLNRTLATMAKDPEVIAAAVNKDAPQLSAQAEKLEKHFPDALKIRLLLPGVSEVDNKSEPHMGFADLDMVKESFKGAQSPSIQGDEGPDRHLAITQQIMKNEQVVGVILASMRYSFIHKLIKETKPDNMYLELKQGKLVLDATGNDADKEGQKNAQVTIPGSKWMLQYWYNDGADLLAAGFIILIILLPLLLILLAFFSGHRRLSLLLSQDLSTIVKAFKDLMGNKPQATYPINLAEMNAIIPTLVQFKRVVDSNEISISETEDFELSGYFGVPNADGLNVKELNDDIASLYSDNVEIQPEVAAKNDDFESIFRAYDIRGIVDKNLTEEIVHDIGLAMGTMASKNGCQTIVLGRDGRVSSPLLANALAQGIIATGCNVMDIGMIPTPVLYFVTQHTDGRTGVMITGSHNPAEYNGLKIVLNGETLSGDKIQDIKQLILDKSFVISPSGQISQNNHYIDEYIGMIREDINIDRPMKIVIDAGNGVTGALGPLLFKNLDCDVIELHCDIDGSFPNHHPDPSNPENMDDLISAVKFYGADIGIAFDGDGDRLGVIDNAGKIIWPDRQMMLFAKDILAAKPGSEIIYDVKCSRHLTAQIAKYGGRGTMWKTGHSLMKAKLKETGAKLAGEMSGHIFFNDRWFGFDDALYSAARLLEILARDSRSSADVFAEFPDSINTPELSVPLKDNEKFAFVEALTSAADFANAKITTIDGLRVDFSNGWGLVRASNTTPSLVVRFEADTDEAMADIQAQFRTLMKKIKPDIELPF